MEKEQQEENKDSTVWERSKRRQPTKCPPALVKDVAADLRATLAWVRVSKRRGSGDRKWR